MTEILQSVFGPAGTTKPGGLARAIGRAISSSRSDWPTSLLREIWKGLVDVAEGRRKSAAHEAAWLNLAGFALRPGFGFAMDDWRMETTWDLLRGKLIHSTPEVRNQWWIMWRRIAGGLTGGQQNAVIAQLLGSIRQTAQQMKSGKGKGGVVNLHESDAAEIWRVLGAFEQLPPGVKREMGDIMLQFLQRPKMKAVHEPLIWALGRIGSRVPLNGNAQSTVHRETAERWVGRLMSMQLDEYQTLPLCLMQMSRRTDDRFIDLSESVRQEAADYVKQMGGYRSLVRLIREGGEADSETATRCLGNRCPWDCGLAARRWRGLAMPARSLPAAATGLDRQHQRISDARSDAPLAAFAVRTALAVRLALAVRAVLLCAEGGIVYSTAAHRAHTLLFRRREDTP